MKPDRDRPWALGPALRQSAALAGSVGTDGPILAVEVVGSARVVGEAVRLNGRFTAGAIHELEHETAYGIDQ